MVTAKDYAVDSFKKANLAVTPLQTVSPESMKQFLNSTKPDLVLTSAASLPTLDMTEKLLWDWAKEQKIPSLAVLDQWQNYALRFSGPTPLEHLIYFPDTVAVMDQRAKEDMIKAGIDNSKTDIVVTGQPALGVLVKFAEAFSPEQRDSVRKKNGVNEGTRFICFVSEAIKRDFGESLGFTEFSALDGVVSVCEELVSKDKKSIHLALKLHPTNVPAEFEAIVARVNQAGRIKMTVHWTEQAPLPLILSSDVVIGMASVLLIESLLLKCPTVSYQPSAKVKNSLVATEIGAIPLVSDRKSCFEIMDGLLNHKDYRARYLEKQKAMSADANAAVNVLNIIRKKLS